MGASAYIAMTALQMFESRKAANQARDDQKAMYAQQKADAEQAATDLATTTHDQTTAVGGAAHMAARESVQQGGSTYLTAGRTAGVSGPTGKGKRKKIGSMATYDTAV